MSEQLANLRDTVAEKIKFHQAEIRLRIELAQAINQQCKNIDPFCSRSANSAIAYFGKLNDELFSDEIDIDEINEISRCVSEIFDDLTSEQELLDPKPLREILLAAN